MKKRIGFLAYHGVEELDLIGPWEIAGIWHEFSNGPEIVIIGSKKGLITCSHGLNLQVEYDFFNCPSLDYLLIPGGKGARAERYNAATLQFIRHFLDHGQFLMSVCTAILIVYETGLLKGKKVTTYHLAKDELKNNENIALVDARYHRDGKIWTSAGVSAGIDMMIAFIAHTAGDETAGQVQYLCEYYPEQKIYPFYQAHPLYKDQQG
jgi:transcriptional regulator GlxA family with amidase domain